jgi:hypothetical protein
MYAIFVHSKCTEKINFMAITKNAWIRYKTLDKCFSSRYKKYYIEDLIAECEKVLADLDPEHNGISLRQIRKDIAFMKSSEGWNIELDEIKDGKKLIYRYKDSNFPINNQPMNAWKQNKCVLHYYYCNVLVVCLSLTGYKKLYLNSKNHLVSTKKQIGIIAFDDNPDLKGRHFLGELYQHILDKSVLNINYQPFNSERLLFAYHSSLLS